MVMKKILFLFAALCLMPALTGCLENDIPYPIVEASITAFETEGMVGSSRINANAHTVNLVVNDSVDLSALRITRLDYTEGASLSVPMSLHSRVDLRRPLELTLTTYQDYHWTITASQELVRQVAVEGQIGDAVIDDESHNVIIYVAKGTSLSRVKVLEFSLGGEHGSVVPNLLDAEKYPNGVDFRTPLQVMVRRGWEETSTAWRVFVFQSEDTQVDAKASVFARTVSATMSCNVSIGQMPVVEYRPSGTGDWISAAPTSIQVKGTSCVAELSNLTPATTYNYRVLVNERQVGSGTFTTTEAIPLENGSLDNWSQNGKLWNPWAGNSESFWDTGNRGATTISDSNSCPTDDTWNGHGKAALLESKYLVLKFAAGNIFTGRYVATDGTNGVLDFGRPFHAFPTKLRFHYKYQSSTINRIGDTDLQWLKGQPDSCSIYIILADWDEPFTIKTRKSERSLLDPKGDEHILAYSVLETSQSNDTYQEYVLPIEYRVTDRQPKYIVVVASASKYGDYFIGGDASKLWVDDFELLYE